MVYFKKEYIGQKIFLKIYKKYKFQIYCFIVRNQDILCEGDMRILGLKNSFEKVIEKWNSEKKIQYIASNVGHRNIFDSCYPCFYLPGLLTAVKVRDALGQWLY